MLDDFSNPDLWLATASDQVGATLRPVEGPDGGRALCLDYDFHGVSGYAVMRRALPMSHPARFEYAFALRGDAPVNNFEIKLPDASGDNVWWVNRPNWPIPRDWTEVRLKERHFSFAWGPTADRMLHDTQYFELTISAGREGGKGSVCLADLRFRERPAPSAVPPAIVATDPDGAVVPAVVDGDPATSWTAGEGAWPLTLDLGERREFGGLTLQWLPGSEPDYRVELSDDGTTWRRVRDARSDGGRDDLALPESEARYVRIDTDGYGEHRGLAEVELRPLAWAETPNAFVASLAAEAPRGTWPRGFHGEQPAWTLVGIDGGVEQALLGEDGAIETGRGAFSVEPFVRVDGAWVAWADVAVSQSLQDGYLPIPSVRWTHPRFALDVTAFAAGEPASSRLYGRYALTNTTATSQALRLALVARPLQVNGPRQFLSTPGGVSPIDAITVSRDRIDVAGRPSVQLLGAADRWAAATFDAGGARAHAGQAEGVASVRDPTGLASGAWCFDVVLAPGRRVEVAWVAPLSGALPEVVPEAEATQAAVAARWRQQLNHATFVVPPEGQRIVDTLRTALAHMLVSRVGPRLQPGTRSYARAWIRDGAMIGEGLLRLGRADVAAEFLDFYAPYQFDSGKVPCCVDDRGADPVPENDSHGELVYAIAELYRYTGDRERLRRFWPAVQGAVKYMDELRRGERTPAVLAATPAHYGLMPASISHEGYSAKPMHSYWDDFWALRGYKDAVRIAEWLGETGAAKAFAASRDEFAADLYRSIDVATRAHGIDFIPGAAELGDFDATSTTIALSPGGEQARLPQPLLTETFERYWREFTARRDGAKDWDFYTPYELRTVGTFVRLGWRDRAHEALDFFFADRMPEAWNQWAEVVSRTPREPFFVGDLPHAWVASDYVRSALDLFAHEDGDALVLAAGIPPSWLKSGTVPISESGTVPDFAEMGTVPDFGGADVAVGGLRTPWGELAYELDRRGDVLHFHVDASTAPPGGRYLSWPFATPPGATTIDGVAAEWDGGRLRLPPGDVSVAIAID